MEHRAPESTRCWSCWNRATRSDRKSGANCLINYSKSRHVTSTLAQKVEYVLWKVNHWSVSAEKCSWLLRRSLYPCPFTIGDFYILNFLNITNSLLGIWKSAGKWWRQMTHNRSRFSQVSIKQSRPARFAIWVCLELIPAFASWGSLSAQLDHKPRRSRECTGVMGRGNS